MIIVTAATGRYGRVVVQELLRRGVPAGDVVAAVRRPDAASDLADQGLEVRLADYDQPETLASAFAGADQLLLTPSADFGKRYPQMEAAVHAAVEAHVGRVLYASFINTQTSTLRLGEEHKQTEALIRASSLDSTMLRNGAYTELYAGELGDVAPALEAGMMFGAAGTGRISGASRDDLAEAAAAILVTDDHTADAYELGGPAFTLADVATAIATKTGRPLVYQDLPAAKYAAALASHGVPPAFAELLADTSFAATRGDWYTDSTDLEQIIGRPPTPMPEVVNRTVDTVL